MNLIKCSAKAMQLCPDAKICCTQRHPAEFAEGSECHKFNEEVESLFTNADHIRSMSDEELAKWLDWEYGRVEWCDSDRIGTDDCSDIDSTGCIAYWLKQPFKEKEE